MPSLEVSGFSFVSDIPAQLHDNHSPQIVYNLQGEVVKKNERNMDFRISHSTSEKAL